MENAVQDLLAEAMVDTVREHLAGAIEELEGRGRSVYVRWKSGKRPADKSQWAQHLDDLEALTIDPHYPGAEPWAGLC